MSAASTGLQNRKSSSPTRQTPSDEIPKAPKAPSYRTRRDIEQEVLEFLISDGPQTKTKIMYRGFLSYSQLQDYLAVLIADGLIVLHEGHHLYDVTAKGRQYVALLQKADLLRKGTEGKPAK